MKKIKEMYSIFAFYNFQYENVDLYFLDWIHTRCNSKDIGIVKKFWFKCWYCYFSLRDSHYKNENGKKFLFL